MADNVLEPYTFSFGGAKSASTGCSSRVWVLPTSILQRKRSRCIYVCIACYNCVGSQDASKTWKSFCKSNRPFSSSTWSGRLFFCSGSFRVCKRSKQGELVPTHDFWIWFYKSDFKNDCWASPKPDVQQKNCADHVSSLMPDEQIFLEKNLFYENRRWFIQYCIKPELSLPVLKVKSGTNRS